ncbi:MAG TPA: PH domain-containing protein [Acidobacteriota bacterium]|jgi:uncharacterized membrane protein YdbT with pleckstrin-like domain
MTFRKEQLQQGEAIIIDTHPHFVTVVVSFALLVVATLVAIGLANWKGEGLYLLIIVPFGIWFFVKWLNRISHEYIVTNFRVVKQQGLFTKASVDAPLDHINNIFHEQNFFQKLIDNGKVALETASELGMVEFPNVPHPVAFKNSIVAQREHYRSASGSGGAALSPVEALERLAKLKEQGFVTEEEFQAKKKKLLEQM